MESAISRLRVFLLVLFVLWTYQSTQLLEHHVPTPPLETIPVIQQAADLGPTTGNTSRIAEEPSLTLEELSKQAPIVYESEQVPIVHDGSVISMKVLGNKFFKALSDVSDQWETLAAARDKNSSLDETMLDDTARTLAVLALKVATEFLLHPFPALPGNIAPPDVSINCSNVNYATALTGQLDNANKTIIDMVLFGFDVELLEIRLLEYYDLVDKFLVVEQTTNLKGVPKPKLLVPHLLKGRLARFQGKIDYLPLNMSHIDVQTINNDSWTIERHLRDLTGEYVKKNYRNSGGGDSSTGNNDVFVIQNDGDEIPSRTAMAHFQRCELQNKEEEVRFPAFSLKRNAAWVQKTGRMDFFGLLRTSPLGKYIWAPGPAIIPLSSFHPIDFRQHPHKPCRHMGLGSANHFSDPSHPVSNFVKKFSTSDSTTRWEESTKQFWDKAKLGQLSYFDIRSLNFMCHRSTGSYPWISLETLDEASQQTVVASLPWVLRLPGSKRYGWLYHEFDFVHEERLFHDCVCKKDIGLCLRLGV